MSSFITPDLLCWVRMLYSTFFCQSVRKGHSKIQQYPWGVAGAGQKFFYSRIGESPGLPRSFRKTPLKVNVLLRGNGFSFSHSMGNGFWYYFIIVSTEEMLTFKHCMSRPVNILCIEMTCWLTQWKGDSMSIYLHTRHYQPLDMLYINFISSVQDRYHYPQFSWEKK